MMFSIPLCNSMKRKFWNKHTPFKTVEWGLYLCQLSRQNIPMFMWHSNQVLSTYVLSIVVSYFRKVCKFLPKLLTCVQNDFWQREGDETFLYTKTVLNTDYFRVKLKPSQRMDYL